MFSQSINQSTDCSSMSQFPATNSRFYPAGNQPIGNQPINPFTYEAPVDQFMTEDFDRFSTVNQPINQPINQPLSTEDDSDRSVDSRSVRRILTSPSSLYQLPNDVYNQQMVNPHQKMYQPAYPVNWEHSYAPNEQYYHQQHHQQHQQHQQMHQMNHYPNVVRPNASSASLSTLSPSSSASTASSIPPSINQSMNQAPYVMDPGMRRIKSTPHMTTASISGVKRKSSDVSSVSINQSVDVPVKTPQAKAARRLARKAEAARASRRKKKQYINNLEDRVAKLTARLEAVQSNSQTGNQPINQPKLGTSHVDAVHREEQQSIKDKMLSLLNDIKLESGGSTLNPSTNMCANLSSTPSSSASVGSNDTNVDSSKLDDLKGLVDMFVSVSHKRGTSIDVYLSLLSRALMPSVPLKFVMWGLSQSDEFYKSDGLWSGVMAREVGLSSEEMHRLIGHRDSVTNALTSLNTLFTQLNSLRTSMKQHLDDRQRVLDDVITTLTPTQVASFCLWVQQNPMCMQMIDSVWKQAPHAQNMS